MGTTKIRKLVNDFAMDDSGSNALEYGLIVGLISLAIVAGATTAGASLGTLFTTVGTKLATVSTTVSA
jgi:pilus assembly protein Flp/PilA